MTQYEEIPIHPFCLQYKTEAIASQFNRPIIPLNVGLTTCFLPNQLRDPFDFPLILCCNNTASTMFLYKLPCRFASRSSSNCRFVMSCVHEFPHVRNLYAREMVRLPASRMKYFTLQSKVSVSQPSYFFTV